MNEARSDAGSDQDCGVKVIHHEGSRMGFVEDLKRLPGCLVVECKRKRGLEYELSCLTLAIGRLEFPLMELGKTVGVALGAWGHRS